MIPDHAALEIIPIFVVLLLFSLGSGVFSVLQFLGNFLHSILDEDGVSSPILYKSGFSLVELDLPNEWPLIISVSEIQAHVVTQLMRILNLSVSYAGSPCCNPSSIIFVELNFHQELLVELFVQGVLGSRSSA